MKRTKSLIITKRDGTLERFSVEKLRSCLGRVLSATADEPRLADPLSRAIKLHLQESGRTAMSSSEYVFRCARSVLLQTGLSDAARGLVSHRRLRIARRRRVRVYDPLETGREPVRWRKSAVVASLQNVYNVRQAVARFLAGHIENRVLELGYRLVSRPFLAELVRNEMLAWGLPFDRVPVAPVSGVGEKPLDSGPPPKED